MKFKAWFNVTLLSIAPGMFVDEEMWIEFDWDNFEEAEFFVLPVMAKHLADQNKGVTKIELLKIRNNKEVRNYLKPE